MDPDWNAETDLILAILGRLLHDTVERLSELGVGEVSFLADANECHSVGHVEWTFPRDEFPLFAARAEGLGLGPQCLFFFGGELEAAERVGARASKDVNTVERFFGGGAKLMKICHWVSSTLPQNQFGRAL
jgi:hypothetical protein